jgi:hypothetical protein
MNTLHHGFWTYFFFRKKKHLVKWLVFGAVAPDLIYFIMFLVMGIQQGILKPGIFLDLFKLPMFGFSSNMSNMALAELHDFILEMFRHPLVEVLRYIGHSLFVWGIIFGLLSFKKGWRLSPFMAFLLGWIGHIITDLLTHVTDATPIFYPISDLIIRGPISYWNPSYFGQEFNLINNLLFAIAVIYLVYEMVKTRRQKKKERDDFFADSRGKKNGH